MKTQKILVIAMAGLLTLMVGYALFSESVTINGTASAKGEFDFSVECTPGLTSDVLTPYEQLIDGISFFTATKEDGYENDICSGDGKKLTYSVDLKYPTANRFFTAKITNTGAVAMKLDEASMDSTTEYYLDGVKKTTSTLSTYEFAYYVDGKEYFDDYYEEIENAIIEPGETAIIVLGAYWQTRTPSSYNGKTQQIIYTVTFPFVQAN